MHAKSCSSPSATGRHFDWFRRVAPYAILFVTVGDKTSRLKAGLRTTKGTNRSIRTIRVYSRAYVLENHPVSVSMDVFADVLAE
jgi:hypothetical protein